MTLTLLLDLDNTLLDSNMDDFIPAYFQALGNALGAYVPAEKMLKYLMQGTHAMMTTDTPEHTLGEIFGREYYPNLDVDLDAFNLEIARFYDQIFPTLAYLTKPRPEAVDLVEWAFAQGYRVAIATNPLFPREAIHHRLRWANLPPEKYPFEVISSFETFHFCKPNPAYLAEVLGQMGWPDAPTLMVGDDPENDMLAAQGLGVPMFWVADDEAVLPKGCEPVAGRGSIGDLRPWLESIDKQILLPQYQAQSAIVATAKAIPAALKVILSAVPIADWRRCPNPEEWCLVEVLGHLRDVEREVNLSRIQTFLSERNPFIVADDTDLWAAERGYAQQDGEAALRDFIAARMETLDALNALQKEDWERSGRHAIFGPITLYEQLGFMAEHDRVHLRQIHDILQEIPR